MLPVFDRVGRRWLLLVGAVICGILHFATGAVMASYGHHVDSVDGKSCPRIYPVFFYMQALSRG